MTSVFQGLSLVSERTLGTRLRRVKISFLVQNKDVNRKVGPNTLQGNWLVSGRVLTGLG